MLLIVISSSFWSIYPVYQALWVVWVNIFLVNSMVIMLIKTILILAIRHLHQTAVPFPCDEKSNQWAREGNGQANNYRYFAGNKIEKAPRNGEHRYHWNAISKYSNIKPISDTTTFWRIVDILFWFLRRVYLSFTLHFITSSMNRTLICSVRKSIGCPYIIHYSAPIFYKNSRGCHG